MRSRRTGLRVLGAALALYGALGMIIFVGVAAGVAPTLEHARQLTGSTEQQRTALVASLSQAETTIRGMSTSATNMNASLGDVKTAIDRASTISHSAATSMYSLRDAMTISILGAQPLVGLSGGFDTTGQNLDQLGNDIAGIGTALDTNRGDVTTTSQNLSDLADTVHALVVSVEDGPGLAISSGTLDTVRLAVYAVTGWLALFALGCIVAGVYLIYSTRTGVTA